VGEAGVGKSRLLDEVDSWLELHDAELAFFQARALATRRRVPVGVVHDLLARRFDVVDSDPADVAVAKVCRGLEPALDDQEQHLLARWAGFHTGGAAAHLAAGVGDTIGVALLARYLRAVALERPVVALVEDMHWADRDSVRVLDALVPALADVPVAFVVATRPDLFAEQPDWGTSSGMRDIVELAPLDRADSESLVREILQRVAAIPDELVAIVASRAEGNPFYIEELVKLLIDDGVIDSRAEPWTVDTDRLDLVGVPASLTAVLQARLDSLSLGAQRTLQVAAVVGRVFWDAAVVSVCAEATWSEPLVGELIVERSTSQFTGVRELVFKHALLHEVTYETVLRSERPALHGAVADWLEHVAGERAEERRAEIAEHRSRAGQLEQAADDFERAATAAYRSGAFRTAHDLVVSSIELHGRLGRSAPARLWTLAGSASRQCGPVGSTIDLLARAVEVARAGDDLADLAGALYELSLGLDLAGEIRRGREQLDEALRYAVEIDDDRLRALVLSGLTWSALHEMDGDDLALAEASRLAADASGDPVARARSHGALAAVLNRRGEHLAAIGQSELAAQLCLEHGELASAVRHRIAVGVAWHLLGDRGDHAAYTAARDAYDVALGGARRYAMPIDEAMVMGNVAQLEVRRGSYAEGAQLARDALAIQVRLGAVSDMVFSVIVHSEALAGLGDLGTATSDLSVVAAHPALGMLAPEVDAALDRLPSPRPALRVPANPVGEFDRVVERVLASGATGS
jgi:tetratricopeptide (TPR) repeat protein